MQLVTAGFDARQVEDFIDQVEEMLAGLMDIADIFLVGRVRHRSQYLVLHDFREAEDRVQRRPQLM